MRTAPILLCLSVFLFACPEPEPELILPDQLEEGWTEIRTGGDTRCSRDTPFSWFIRKGSVNKLVVDFMGGGACWDETTCSVADAIFTDSVEGIRTYIMNGGAEPGLYDSQNDDNPFKDWYYALVPYCTGDIHWGSTVTTYGEGFSSVTIHHRGADNARAVLNWVGNNFSGPEQIMSTGCSAGAYGSIMWSAHLAEMYPDADMFQFGDSGAGVITDEFFRDSFPSWAPEGAFPSWIPSLDPETEDLEGKELADLYVGIANQYPDHRFSQFNTSFDGTQVRYYEFMGGGTAEEWSTQMLASIETIEAGTDNFSSFIPANDYHCIVGSDDIYTESTEGVQLLDWINDSLNGASPPSAKCVDCTPPE